jgi:HAD superfamily hydrolase (TIGR01490 family)
MDSFLKYYTSINKKNIVFNFKDPNCTREELNLAYYKIFTGENIQYLDEIGKDWFLTIDKVENYNQIIINELNIHKNNGAGIILVSGSMHSCLDPLKDKLGASYVICSNQKVVSNTLTGELVMPQTVGSGKAWAIKSLCNIQNIINLDNSYAYGDHISDLDMLSLVGNPVVVGSDEKLLYIAKQRKWRIIDEL